MKCITVNNIEVRRANRNRIYCYIHQNEEISKQEIAHALHISLPTVTQNLHDLMDQNLVKEGGMLESTGGRKATAYSCNFSAKTAVGLDITKNHVGVVVVDLKGTVLCHQRIRCTFIKEEAYFERIHQLIEEILTQSNIARESVVGVGIAVPAIISSNHQEMSYSPALGETDCHLSDFTRYIPYPCTLFNDANAAGFAETWGRDDIGNIAFLSLSFTVGGAILIDGHVYGGENRRSAEFGHMTLVPNGKECYCGKRGCVDAYLSAHCLAECADGSIAEFFEKLKQGDKTCKEVWQEYVQWLAITVNNLRMIFDCRVVIGGYVGPYIEDFFEDIKKQAESKDTFKSNENYLSVCNYRLEATAVGAALQYIDRFIKKI